MSVLANELRNVQNPALGAMLIWQFTAGYCSTQRSGGVMPIPACYITLPILLHSEIAILVQSTQARTGLRGFVDKFVSTTVSKTDLLLEINSRAVSLRQLTTSSVSLALRS